MRRTFFAYEITVLIANFHRGNSTTLSGRILHLSRNTIVNMEHVRGLYRRGLAPKQTAEHVAKRVKSWGRKKTDVDVKEIGNIY